MIDGFQIKISFLPILKISSMNKTISKLIAKLFLTSLPLIRKIFFSIFFYLQFTVAHGTILRRSEGPWDESVISCHEKKIFFALSSFYFPALSFFVIEDAVFCIYMKGVAERNSLFTIQKVFKNFLHYLFKKLKRLEIWNTQDCSFISRNLFDASNLY